MIFAPISCRLQLLFGIETNSLKDIKTLILLKKGNKRKFTSTPLKMIQCNGNMNTYNDSLPNKIGFIGGGKMALALGKGFMAAGLVSPDQVSFFYSCSK